MDFSKVKHGVIVTEFVGSFVLILSLLAALWGFVPTTLPIAVLAGLVLGLFVLAFSKMYTVQLNPATTIGLYTLRKINSATAISCIIAQLAGALLAMVVMNLFLDGDLVSKYTVVADYKSFFAEFLGMLIFSFGIAAAIHHKLEGINLALLLGGMYAVGIMLAFVGGNGLINPAVAVGVSSLNWSYVLGPVLGAIIGMNLYAAVYGKKGDI